MKYTELINKMTLEEKCALLSGKGEWVTRAYPQYDIPEIFLSDGPSGVRKQEGAGDHLGLNESVPATCWPAASTIANSWDEKLGEEVGAALGEEAKALGVNVLLGPGLNIKRSPLCGRNFEYFSEDPWLSGKMAAGVVRGVQSNGISACPKHFAVNSQEHFRMANDSIVDERTLRELYLTGFEIVVKEAKPKTIMTSYNLVNGTYANENKHLLKSILRGEWGYEGAVVSDWGGSNDHAKGVEAGSDLEMPAPGLSSVRELIDAVKSGKLSESAVNERVDTMLDLIFSTQIQNPAGKDGFDKDAHHALARRAAAESIVLLKNDASLLPLSSGQKVAVIGDFAETPRYQGAGSSQVNPVKLDTFLKELPESGLTLSSYAQGYRRGGKADKTLLAAAVETAKSADTVIFFIGLDELKESEGLDRSDMRINGNQIDVLEAVAAANPNVIAVLVGGSAVEMPWIDSCKALIYCGLGGEAGAGAALDVLTGRVNPSGKLSETYPMEYADTPAYYQYPGKKKTSQYREGIFVGYRYYEKAKIPVRFPFGFGLSYTSFAYSNLKVTKHGAEVTVTNTGTRDGAEIVQLYVHKSLGNVGNAMPIFRPEKELKGFSKVFLKAGEAKKVHFEFDDKTFRYWNTFSDSWETEDGSYRILVGGSSADTPLSGELIMSGSQAQDPYRNRLIASYRKGEAQEVTDNEFKELLGHPLPSDELVIDRNLTFGQLNHGRSLIGWIVWAVLTCILKLSLRSGKPNLNILFIYNMPLRALAKMTQGAFSMGMVDGMVMEVKGFWIIGIVKVIIELFKKNKADKALAAKLGE